MFFNRLINIASNLMNNDYCQILLIWNNFEIPTQKLSKNVFFIIFFIFQKIPTT